MKTTLIYHYLSIKMPKIERTDYQGQGYRAAGTLVLLVGIPIATTTL